MAKVATNLSIEAELKQQSIELFSDLGMDLSTAVPLFLKQSVRVQGIPFIIGRSTPNEETISAMNEYYMVRERPEQYKRYSSLEEAREDVLAGRK